MVARVGAMGCRGHVRISFLIALALTALLPALGQAGEVESGWAAEVRELVEQLHRVSLDPDAAYRVEELYLRRDALRLELTHGMLVFLQPVVGQVTGAVFVGEGRILVMPPAQSERQQLARFTGSPILAEAFSSAYFRFTDATEAEWRAQIEAGRGSATQASDVLAQWNGLVQAFNPAHSLRVLVDLTSQQPKPYFSAVLTSRRLGQFEAFLDERREEEVLLGQAGWKQERPYYDIWCSFPREAPGRTSERTAHQVDAYRIETTIQHDHSLEGTAKVHFQAGTPGDRMVLFDLSRFLHVEEVTTEADEPLPFFQNEALEPEQLRALGSDQVLVVLPEPLARGRVYTLRLRYRGRVISELGNGVLYVGARGIWYPTLSPSGPALFEMEFRYPRALALVASGRHVADREEGPWRVSHWRSEVPIPMAGFNLGAYETHARVHQGVPLRVYANQQLEPALAQPLTQPPVVLPPEDPLSRRSTGLSRRPLPDLLLSLPPPLPPPRPAALMEEVAEEVAQALDFFIPRFGPFPYPQLNVSQIPGRFGQGYPGLLYLSTFTFLRGAEQTRLGLSERSREHFSGLVPIHETAHQWWGN
ncbi:MAG: hypothetical protein HY653_01235, partial [Acidobacteria bacterium]|nr:hypothetical protein [Acidobacteriota bacterium]